MIEGMPLAALLLAGLLYFMLRRSPAEERDQLGVRDDNDTAERPPSKGASDDAR